MEENTSYESGSGSGATSRGFWAGIGELLRFGVIVIIIVLGIRVFIAQPFVVSGTSMVPTFQNANYLIVDELSYRFGEPKRGDVIIFRPPVDPGSYYIKRIIGVPGDTVSINYGVVTIINAEHPEGITLNETYVTADEANDVGTYTVTDGNYFVMGDNRPVSFDSRRWGLLPEKNIVGKAFLRLFPLDELSILPGHTK